MSAVSGGVSSSATKRTTRGRVVRLGSMMVSVLALVVCARRRLMMMWARGLACATAVACVCFASSMSVTGTRTHAGSSLRLGAFAVVMWRISAMRPNRSRVPGHPTALARHCLTRRLVAMGQGNVLGRCLQVLRNQRGGRFRSWTYCFAYLR